MLSLYMLISFAIVSLKNTTTILLALAEHQAPTFTGWRGTSWIKCGFSELQ
jgi:hypothetical protein